MKKQLFAILCCLSVLPAHAGFDLDPAVAGSLSPNKANAKTAAEAPTADAGAKADAIAMLTEAKKASSVAAQGDSTKSSPPSSIAPTGAGTPAPVTPSMIRDWQIKPSDLTIYATLRRWAKEAGWQVSWEVPVDYPATLTSNFRGSFEDATESVLTAYKNTEFPLQGCFYQANQVLRVTRYVANSRDCQ